MVIQEDTKEYKNLFTSDGLCPTLKDLEQIFDNSDDAASGDETVRLVSVHPSYIILVCSVCCLLPYDKVTLFNRFIK